MSPSSPPLPIDTEGSNKCVPSTLQGPFPELGLSCSQQSVSGLASISVYGQIAPRQILREASSSGATSMLIPPFSDVLSPDTYASL